MKCTSNEKKTFTTIQAISMALSMSHLCTFFPFFSILLSFSFSLPLSLFLSLSLSIYIYIYTHEYDSDI